MIRSSAGAMFALFSLIACGRLVEPQMAGGTTDTGNTIVGAVQGEDGLSAGIVDLALRPSDYLSRLPSLGKTGAALLSILDTTTNADGSFKLSNVDKGAYRIEARQGN